MQNHELSKRVSQFLTPRLIGIGLLLGPLLLAGCDIRPKPFVHLVEYESSTTCAPDSSGCAWERLEHEAELSALVNCLLAGANVLEIKEEGEPANQVVPRVVAPLPPRYGYERRLDATPHGGFCLSEQRACSVTSRHERAITWASCGTRELDRAEFRGGEDQAHADNLRSTAVVTGTLAKATDDYSLTHGLDGPDHWYRFTVSDRTRIEAAVAANRALWSGVVGLVQSAWQPALYLLSSDGVRIQQGYVLRAGVTALLPSELAPGTYYLIVDSSVQEWQRGDGLYRLYLGLNQTLMGPPIERNFPTN